jgi:hypothetical protein
VTNVTAMLGGRLDFTDSFCAACSANALCRLQYIYCILSAAATLRRRTQPESGSARPSVLCMMPAMCRPCVPWCSGHQKHTCFSSPSSTPAPTCPARRSGTTSRTTLPHRAPAVCLLSLSLNNELYCKSTLNFTHTTYSITASGCALRPPPPRQPSP